MYVETPIGRVGYVKFQYRIVFPVFAQASKSVQRAAFIDPRLGQGGSQEVRS